MEDMNINSVKAKVLTAALPYIQKYNGKTVVVKYGGNAMIHPLLKKAVMSDIILLKLVGINIVLVHGGGPEISSMLERLDIPSRFVNGLRYTDEETIEIVQMVLSGKTNKDLVSLIEQLGGTAIGMCGIDAGMIQAKKLEGDYGYVGDITHINTEPIENAHCERLYPRYRDRRHRFRRQCIQHQCRHCRRRNRNSPAGRKHHHADRYPWAFAGCG